MATARKAWHATAASFQTEAAWLFTEPATTTRLVNIPNSAALRSAKCTWGTVQNHSPLEYQRRAVSHGALNYELHRSPGDRPCEAPVD